MKKNYVLTTLLLVCTLLTGCGNESAKPQKDNFDNTQEEVSVSLQEAESSTDDYGDKEFFMEEGQVVKLGDEVVYGELVWTVSGIEITKEIGSRDKTEFNYFDEITDEAGNLTGGQSYVFLTLSCKNTSEETQEVLLNDNGFVNIDESLEITETGIDARYISKKQEGNNSQEKAFHYILDSGQEMEKIEIGYILRDEIMEETKDLYYCFGTQGSSLGTSEKRFIKVELE